MAAMLSDSELNQYRAAIDKERALSNYMVQKLVDEIDRLRSAHFVRDIYDLNNRLTKLENKIYVNDAVKVSVEPAQDDSTAEAQRTIQEAIIYLWNHGHRDKDGGVELGNKLGMIWQRFGPK
jgi:hypothetical protein